ncbi:MAG: peptidase M3 [Proteobacteria bacterium]|nr:MAG: peptidase M3 [Pseudomonadota bacterium]
MARRLSLFFVALVFAACTPEDPRKPAQPRAAQPPVPAAELPADPFSDGDRGTKADPTRSRPLIDGVEDARLLLEQPEWGNAERLANYCEDSIARAQIVRRRLQQAGRADADVIKDFELLRREVDTAEGLASLMFNTSPVKQVRDAAQKCEQDVAAFGTEVSLDRALFRALAAVKVEPLDALSKRFVEHGLRDFRRSGIDKDDATRERIKAINARMVELTQSFRRNINADVKDIAVDAKLLEAMPADWLANHAVDEQGRVRVTTNYPDFYPFETYVADDALRRELYEKFALRAFPLNKPIIAEVLKLRKELATILGYPSWAEYIVEDKMTGSAATVEAFITDVASIVRPRAVADLEELLARKRKDQPGAKAIETHDRFYYVQQVRKERFDFDPKSVRPYFSYPAVKEGVLDLYAELFDLEFVKLEDAPVWHPTVDAYEMRSHGKLIGRFYLDMHPRENKYSHAAAFPIQSGTASGRIPWASLVCNFPNPADGDGKALMEHSDVQTYLHEFGHLVHHLLGSHKSDFVGLNGFNVEWDFVEAPSQLLEEWGWRPEVLQRFAKHVDTGEPIPAKLVDKMRGAEELGKGLANQRQVFYAAYSFFLHSVAPDSLDLDAFTDEMYAKYSPYPRLENGKIYCNFGHLMGYSAIYYTYQWSLSISKDLFTRFAREGLLNKETAMAYRREVLEPGGTKDADELVKAFLGRERNLDAYKAWMQKAPGK